MKQFYRQPEIRKATKTEDQRFLEYDFFTLKQ